MLSLQMNDTYAYQRHFIRHNDNSCTQQCSVAVICYIGFACFTCTIKGTDT